MILEDENRKNFNQEFLIKTLSKEFDRDELLESWVQRKVVLFWRSLFRRIEV